MWIIIVTLALCVIGVGVWWYMRRASGQQQIGPTDIDTAFDNSAPPTNMSLDGGNQFQETDYETPNTTELMNDFQDVSRRSVGGRSPGRRKSR